MKERERDSEKERDREKGREPGERSLLPETVQCAARLMKGDVFPRDRLGGGGPPQGCESVPRCTRTDGRQVGEVRRPGVQVADGTDGPY